MEAPSKIDINDLPKDIMVFLSMELNLPDLTALCIANKAWDSNVCKNDTFWMRRFQRDFPHVPKEPNMTYKQQIEYIYRNDRFPGFKTPKGLPSFYDKSFEDQLVKEGIVPINTPKREIIIFSPIQVKQEIVDFFKGADLGKIPIKYGGGSLSSLLHPLLKKRILTKKLIQQLLEIYIYKFGNVDIMQRGQKYKIDEHMKNTLEKLLPSSGYVAGGYISRDEIFDIMEISKEKDIPRGNPELVPFVNMTENLSKVANQMIKDGKNRLKSK